METSIDEIIRGKQKSIRSKLSGMYGKAAAGNDSGPHSYLSDRKRR